MSEHESKHGSLVPFVIPTLWGQFCELTYGIPGMAPVPVNILNSDSVPANLEVESPRLRVQVVGIKVIPLMRTVAVVLSVLS